MRSNFSRTFLRKEDLQVHKEFFNLTNKLILIFTAQTINYKMKITFLTRISCLFFLLGSSLLTLTAISQEIVSRKVVGTTDSGINIERIEYMSEGHQVWGYYAEPKSAGPHPVVVRLRGGNRSFGAYSPERAVRALGNLANWGYVAIAPQYRGADDPEEGESLDEFGGSDVNDIFTMIEMVGGFESADTSRIALEGWSRGGMMTYLALKKSNRFDAAIVIGGVADLNRMVDDRPIMMEVFTDLFAGDDADQFEQNMIDRSAVNWANQLPKSTPILILHGTSDWRVTPFHAFDMSAGLQNAQVPYRLIMFEGGDHSISEFATEREAQRKAWLNKYVKNGRPAPDLTPHGN